MKTDKKGMFNEPLGCNTQLMYDRIMGIPGNKDFPGFAWGGLEDKTKQIYMDENNLRFTTNQRLQMMTLAKLLNDEGKHDQAKKVLDRMNTVMPKEHVPYEPAMVYAVDGYYHANAMKEANDLSKDLFDQCEEEYKFYSKLASEPGGNSYDDDANRLGSALQMLGEYASQYGQKDLETNYSKRLTDLGLHSPDDPRMPQGPQGQQGPGQQPQQIDQKMLDSMMKSIKQDSAKGPKKKLKSSHTIK